MTNLNIPPEKAYQNEIVNLFKALGYQYVETDCNKQKYLLIKQGAMQKLLSGQIRLPKNY